jgi:hypothetical protein
MADKMIAASSSIIRPERSDGRQDDRGIIKHHPA